MRPPPCNFHPLLPSLLLTLSLKAPLYPKKSSPVSAPLLGEALLTPSAGTSYTFVVLHTGLDLSPVAASPWGWDPGLCPQTL